MPFASPLTVNRRCTPANSPSASAARSKGMPSSWATAQAARAFSTLCAPTILSTTSPSRFARCQTAKRALKAESFTSSARQSACGEIP